MKHSFALLAMAALPILSACTSTPEPQNVRVGLANPASVYCHQLGGKSEPVQTPQGAHAICVLPDGTRIEEWALYRRDHPAK